MPLFEPFKDNKPWRRLLSIGFGLAFLIWALAAIRAGQITVTKENITLQAANEPVVFWLADGFIIVLGIGLIYRGIRGKRDDA